MQQKENMSTLVTLSPEAIIARVNTTNSFSKAEAQAHLAQIKDARAAKRERLKKLGGAQLGAMVDQLAKERNAFIAEIKERTGVKKQSWFIRLDAVVHKSEADRLKDKARKLQDQLNKVEEELTKATATKV